MRSGLSSALLSVFSASLLLACAQPVAIQDDPALDGTSGSGGAAGNIATAGQGGQPAAGQNSGGAGTNPGSDGTAGKGTAGSGQAGTAGKGTAGQQAAGSGNAGQQAAGSGQAGSGQAGSGQAGSGQAGSGNAGSGNAGQQAAGSGQAGSGQAGSGQAGSGNAGSGQAGSGTAGSGNAGSGQAGSGQAGSGQAGSGNAGSGASGGEAGHGGDSGGACTGRLVVNEVSPEGDTSADEYVELFNPTPCAVSMAGWKLLYSSAKGSVPSTLWTGLDTDSVAAGGYLVIAGSDFPGVSQGKLGSGLKLDGGGVGLSGPDDLIYDSIAWGTATSGNPFVEGAPAGSIAVGKSAARLPNGADSDRNDLDFSTTASRTPGAKNK